MIALLLAAALTTAPPEAAATPLFAPAAVAIDPARLAVARTLALKLVPPGTYQRMLNGGVSAMMGRMTDGMLDLPVKQLIGAAGLSPEQIAKLGSGTSRQIMAIVDPHFEERMRLTTKAMLDGMGSFFAQFEPEIREGFATAYATRFDAAQLAELNHFFESPTGSAFAAQQLTMMNDPAVAERLKGVLPGVLKQMPEIMKSVQAATASLPNPKTAAELSDSDRQKLAALLGISADKLKASAAAKAKTS